MSYLFGTEACGKALAHNLVGHDAGSHRHIERTDGTEDGYGGEIVAGADYFGGEAGVFGTHHDGYRAGAGHVGVGLVGLFACADYGYAALLQIADGLLQRAYAAHGQVHQGACRGLHGVRVGGGAAAFGNDYGVSPGTFGRAADGSAVAPVGPAPTTIIS